MPTITQLKQKRQGYRLNVEKVVKLVIQTWELREQVAPDQNELVIIRDKLQKYEQALALVTEEVAANLPPDEFATDSVSAIEFSEKIWDAQSKISLMQTQIASVAGDTASLVGSHSKEVQAKLPKLDLPKFDGDFLKWQEFWDSFDSTIHQSDMSAIDKLKYLRGLLRGDALKVIGGNRLIAANYSTIVETLKQRYGNPEVAIFSHFERLLALPTAVMDTASLQSANDECEKHIRSLIALGLGEQTFGQVFTPIILSKMPRPVRVELHRKNGSKPWTLSNLRELLREEITARQMGDWTLGENLKGKEATKHSTYRRQVQPTPVYTKPNRPSISTFVQSSKSLPDCLFCHEKHFSDQCSKVTSLEARKSAIRSGGHCFKCLSTKHMAGACTKKGKCFHCSQSGHHSSLCPSKYGKTASISLSSSQANSNSQVSASPEASNKVPLQITNSAVNSGGVFMQMAVVQFSERNISARLFFDGGSTCSYVTTRMSKELGLKPQGKVTVSNTRFEDNKRRIKSYPLVKMDIPAIDGSMVSIDAFVTDTISCPLQKLPLDKDRFPLLQKIILADPPAESAQFVEIDILIGSDHYFDFVSGEHVTLGNGLRLLGSKLGYITSGKADNRDLSEIKEGLTFVSCLLSPIASPTSYCDIERFWSLEDIGVRDDSFKKDDEVALEKFNESVQLVNGRYEAGWPWKDGISEIPDNFKLAFSRLRSLLRRVEKQDEVVKTYDDTIKAQLQTGVIEQVEDGTSANRVHYIPHHCVIKPDRATTKLRIVYDASSKVNEDVPSLNDCLLRGPVFLSDICALLLRFRTFPVALVSDIEKAFLQVGLRQEDRDVTRFLWVKDYSKPLTRDNLITYRFARVPFGVISSPFLLSATIKHHLIKQRTEIAHHIASNIYVDNVICGRSNLEQSIQFYHEAKSLFQSISMNLREWYSNCPELLQTIPAYDRGKGTTTKVLGMVWDCEGDTFSCTTPKIDNFEVQTKRQLAQLAATVFDPCGLFSPVIVQAKMLIQRVWVLKLGWDDPLPADIVSDWQTCGLDLQCLPEIRIPRLVPSGSSSEPVELHCFCDASKGAYAAAIYVRSNSNFQFETNLIFAKSKLCPTKPISLPRLELMAVVVGVRMLKFVKAEVGIPIKRCLVWTDSKCVLHWLRSVKVMTVFVSNRVKEINSHSGNEFRYVPTDKIPADLPSRGCSTSTLESSCLWWHDPEFLQSSEADWPVTDLGPSPSEGEVAIPATGMALFNLAAPQGLYGVNPSKYSSLNKVLRVTAWVTRYLSALQRARIKRKQEILLEFVSKESLCLTAKEIAASELAWVIHVQQTSFYQESSSPLYNKVRDLKQKLDVFTDSSGLLRCGGRIHHAEVSDETKFPILLPRDHALTRLIIQDCHERLFHAGASHTLGEVRCRFWVPQGKSQVQSVIRKCQLCKLAKGGHFQIPKPPPLPVFRVTQSAPFTFTGVGYLGPLLVKSPDRDCQKVWICLFVCAATRAIHLEVVQNPTTEQFLLALRRFAAMQRKPRMLISDNGKYFKLAHNVLQHIWGEIIHSQRVQDYSLQERIEWKFIPEYAPWMGGFYERLVGLVKTALKNVLRKASVTLVQLQTVVAEVSAVVNSRPLVLPDQAGGLILTPNHLLGRVQFDGYLVDVSQGDAFVPKPMLADELVELWKTLSKLTLQFWDTWSSAYLTALREMSVKKSSVRGSSNHAPKVGCVVLLKDKYPRRLWKVGIISKLNLSNDGRVRSLDVRLSSGKTVTRPLKLVFPIESSVIGEDGALTPPKAKGPNSTANQSTGGSLYRSVSSDELKVAMGTGHDRMDSARSDSAERTSPSTDGEVHRSVSTDRLELTTKFGGEFHRANSAKVDGCINRSTPQNLSGDLHRFRTGENQSTVRLKRKAASEAEKKFKLFFSDSDEE